MIEAYHKTLRPLCKELKIPPLALDILLYTANNADNATANKICKFRGFKPGIVSVYVEKMAEEGLLERKVDSADRRKSVLVVTEKAMPIVNRGRELQREFKRRIFQGLSDDDLAAMEKAVSVIELNVEHVLKNGLDEKE